ncbi:HNH endonuclease [Sulfurimonas sp. SAG-AH-194-C21]|nr:HNH endonuclease [Sulfurimonas sp. SAG-AH-194-C21]MDF1883835.1 HNH endonuclease [Sulfurimonas sp. SAG-AH-194-C21]
MDVAKNFWQAPGNGKGFDSFLGDNSKMNNRTIGILSFIKEKSLVNGYVKEKEYKEEILHYLTTKFNADKNESLKTHFYKPALFYGFIQRNKNHDLSLSIEGNLLLNYYKQENYKECLKLVVNQLDNTTYPNAATEKVQGLKLFPFRILFKLLLENKTISAKFMSENLVHITGYKDIAEYERYKDLIKINSFRAESGQSSKFGKFNTWVINSLVDLNILQLCGGQLSIRDEMIAHIEVLYEKVSFSDMFFSTSTCEVNNSVGEKRVKRDAALILDAKKRDGFLCSINNEHHTFISKGENYVEGHHVIPMFQQKNYNFKLDDVDNIVSLCPNCHREIHSADDKMKILNKLYELNISFMQSNDIGLNDLYKMYQCG